jgi:hypothetical protein
MGHLVFPMLPILHTARRGMTSLIEAGVMLLVVTIVNGNKGGYEAGSAEGGQS